MEGGARRIELCHNLNEGGTTPSYGAIDYCVDRLQLSTRVLVRPRAGNFVYTAAEYDVICADVEQCRHIGAAAVVVGFLHTDGTIDMQRTAEIVRLAHPMEVTFHRAFDEVADPSAALEQVIACGCHKLLTSGCHPTAMEGIATLRQLATQANRRIGIIAASGVTPTNVAHIVRLSGVGEVHGSCKHTLADGTVETDANTVRQLLTALQ